MVNAKTVVIQTTSYDMLVGGGNFVPLGSHPRFLGKDYLYKLGWQIRNSCKVFLLVTFIGGHVRKSSNSMMLVRFLKLPHGFDLLEGNAHAMDRVHTHELEMLCARVGPFIQGSSHDYPPSWGTSSKFQTSTKHYIHQAWHTHMSPSPQVPIDPGHGPPSL
jgi:hypothetical protein